MRNFHRWISTVGMLFLAYLVISGTVLAFQEILGPRVFETTPAATPTLPQDEIERLAITTVHAALMSANAGEPLQAIRVQLRMNGKQPEGTVTLGTMGSASLQTLKFNAANGEALPATPSRPAVIRRPGTRSLNATLQIIHSGEIAGVAGQWLIIATGVSLIILSFTGIWMYFQLLGARWKRGRKNWFWR